MSNSHVNKTIAQALAPFAPRANLDGKPVSFDHACDVQQMRYWAMCRKMGYSSAAIALQQADRHLYDGQPKHDPRSEWA